MKIVSDFDGVLTEQTEEADRMRELFVARLGEISGLDAELLDDCIARGEAAMTAEPTAHGWRAKGRVTAYADEDLFIRNNGLAACFDDWARAGEAPFGEMAARLGITDYADFTALANWAYTEMTRETSQGQHKPLDPAAKQVIERLLARGDQIVIVSNSQTGRIEEMLAASGIPLGDGLTVRGDARKYELADRPQSFEVAGYRIEVGRPAYEEILRSEQPQMVIGDVFSFDLALPLYLARTEPETFGGMHLLLRLRDYTPSWAREMFVASDEPHAQLHPLESLGQVCDI